MKGWITSQTADHFLLPLRMQLAEMIASNSKLLEVGSGTGDLFYLVSPKISFGLGLESSLPLVRYGRSKMKKQGIKNVAIRRARFPETLSFLAKFDVAVASQFFSNLSHQSAVNTLTKMSEICNEILIAEFDAPRKVKMSDVIADSVSAKDREYRKGFWQNGGVEGLAEKCQLTINKKVQGPYKGLYIYSVSATTVDSAKNEESEYFISSLL